jgi:hypothetical protein
MSKLLNIQASRDMALKTIHDRFENDTERLVSDVAKIQLYKECLEYRLIEDNDDAFQDAYKAACLDLIDKMGIVTTLEEKRKQNALKDVLSAKPKTKEETKQMFNNSGYHLQAFKLVICETYRVLFDRRSPDIYKAANDYLRLYNIV